MPQEELLMGRLSIMSHNVWKNDKNLPAWAAKGEDCSAAVRAKGNVFFLGEDMEESVEHVDNEE